MKKFSELTREKVESLIVSSDYLRTRFEEYIQTCEMDYLDDKISCIKSSLKDYEIGFYYPSYISVKNWDAFLDGVKKSRDCFGCSERVESKISQCEKLCGTNLFEHHCKILKDLFFGDEIQSVIDFVEDCGMELYNREIGGNCSGYLDCYIDCLDNLWYDEKNDVVYRPCK